MIQWYEGDLCGGDDAQWVVERERLRARYLNILARLADYHYDRNDYEACLNHAMLLLSHDPCREDAHRFIMRCYVRRGERGQAMRHYEVCERVLRTEFEADPEPATKTLLEQIRVAPDSV